MRYVFNVQSADKMMLRPSQVFGEQGHLFQGNRGTKAKF